MQACGALLTDVDHAAELTRIETLCQELELEIVAMPGDPHPRLITLNSFEDLLAHF